MAISTTIPLAIFASIGGLGVATLVYQIADFIRIHFLHSSTIQSFVHGNESYALITGSSDGLGRAVADELYDRGFNVIIHGRNLEKLKRVRDELHARSSTNKRDVQLLVADAMLGEPSQWVKDFDFLKKLNITAIFLCAGGSPVPQSTLVHPITPRVMKR